MNEIVQMGIDLYEGKLGSYSKDEVETALRNALIDVCGGTVDYKTFLNPVKKYEFFNIVAETLDVLIPRAIENQFDKFVETKNTKFGDKLVFEIPSKDLFPVAVIADGAGLRRQRVDFGSVEMTTKMRGVKIYEEFNRFLSGRINWNNLVDRVATSFAYQIKKDIYDAIYNSYNALGATYGINGTFDADNLVELAAHVEAATGLKPVIYGTKLALSKITVQPGYYSPAMLDEINKQGYLGQFRGIDLIEIQQAHVPGTDNFAIANDFLLVVPAGNDKLVKLGFEGDAIIIDNVDTNRNADLSIEYTFMKKYGVLVLSAGKYGIYRITG